MKKAKNPGVVFAAMGFEAVAIVLGSVYVGQAIDDTLDWGGLGVAMMIFICMTGWFIHLILLMKKYMRDTATDEKDEKQ